MEIPSQLLLVLVTILAVALITTYSIHIIMMERNIATLSVVDATANQIITAILSTVRRACNIGQFSTSVIEIEQRLELNKNFIFNIIKIYNKKYILRIEGFTLYIGRNKVTSVEHPLPFYISSCPSGKEDLVISYSETSGRCNAIHVKVKYDPSGCLLLVSLTPT